ncbi:MAG: 3-methyladenine DNA glycosylase [Akkermansiaceae bacterium]
MKTADFPVILSAAKWRALADEHRKSIEKITVPMRERKSRQEKHPVFDFLHTYYSYPLGRLERWHPGLGITLEEAPEDLFPKKYYRHKNRAAAISRSLLSDKERQRLAWILQLLKFTQTRPPHLACHGLHEWAMVYSGADIRHRGSAPLRLSQKEIDTLVSSRPISCSHFDAFRFYAPDAVQFNRLSPTLLTREENEQPGCIHANMDLYKWAYKSSPWISSDLLRETLFFAIEAREIDMRAAPYDLATWGYSPIKVETSEGRREYESVQHKLYLKGLKIRQKLIDALTPILA